MGSRLDDASGLQHVDHVGTHHCREPVGDGERGAPLRRLVERFLHHALRHRVERGGGLIQKQHRRILEEHTGDRDPLLLAAGKPVPALPHHRVVPLLEPSDDVVDVRGRARGDQFVLGRIRLGVAQILADGGVEQVGLLGDDPDMVDDRLLGERAHVGAGEHHRASLRFVQSGREVQDRGLAGAGRSDERDVLPRFRHERHPVERRSGIGGGVRIAEDDVGELQTPPWPRCLVDRDRIRGILDLRHQVEVLEDAGEQRR